MRPHNDRLADHVADKSSGASILNIANVLTLVRLLCVPVLAWLILQENDQARNGAAAIFVFASVTDLLDGAIARKYSLITNFGKIADPIADKFLTGVALIGLSYVQLLPWWITIVIIFRELAVTLLRFWVIEHGVIEASRGGKAKTLAQMIAITMFLIALPAPSYWWDVSQSIVMAVALLLTLTTAAGYVMKALTLRRELASGAQHP